MTGYPDLWRLFRKWPVTLQTENELGEIRPDLITADQDMQAAVLAQPGLQRKILNVRRMIGKE